MPTNSSYVLTRMKIFLDFDGTLLQTGSMFGPACTSVIAVDEMSPQRVRPVEFSHLPGDEKPQFTPLRYLDQFDLTPERYRECLAATEQIVARTQSMLFPDVEGFLKHFPQTDLAILTYGDEAFQRAKIQHSGLMPKVTKVYVTESQSKCAYIADLALSMGLSNTYPLVLIDDRKEYFDDQNDYGYRIVGVWLDRENTGGVHRATIRVESLTEAANFLKGLDSGLAKV